MQPGQGWGCSQVVGGDPQPGVHGQPWSRHLSGPLFLEPGACCVGPITSLSGGNTGHAIPGLAAGVMSKGHRQPWNWNTEHRRRARGMLVSADQRSVWKHHFKSLPLIPLSRGQQSSHCRAIPLYHSFTVSFWLSTGEVCEMQPNNKPTERKYFSVITFSSISISSSFCCLDRFLSILFQLWI